MCSAFSAADFYCRSWGAVAKGIVVLRIVSEHANVPIIWVANCIQTLCRPGDHSDVVNCCECMPEEATLQWCWDRIDGASACVPVAG